MQEKGVQSGVAIVGMACLFPGAGDLDTYWRNILGGVDATSDPPPEAWDPDVYYDPEFADPDKTYCKRGGYLGSLARFDPLAHGIPPVAVGGEPDQWLALQVATDALADAGASRASPRRCAPARRSSSARAPTSTAATPWRCSAASSSGRRSTFCASSTPGAPRRNSSDCAASCNRCCRRSAPKPSPA